MNTEIFIEGYRLDITTDISSLLTFAIDDVKDFSSRSTTWSKTIVLPGTANNNKLFGHIFQIGQSNAYDSTADNIGYNFNASKSAACLMFQDNLQCFKGVLRLMGIVIDKGRIEYEVAVFGELMGLNVSLTSGKLEDLDFSDYNYDWNETNIVASWDGTPGSGVYFALIDYGTYSDLDKHDWDFRTFRPALYVKEYIDKMFEAAGYRYDSDLFDTTRFKRLVVPHNQKELTKTTPNALIASRLTAQQIINYTTLDTHGNILFTSITGALFSEVGGVFTYIGADTISATIDLIVDGRYDMNGTPPFAWILKVQKNGGFSYYTDGIALTNNSGSTMAWYKSYSLPITLAPGDTFNFNIILTSGAGGAANVYVDNASLSVTTSNAIVAPVAYGDSIDANAAIPKNVRQIDFLVSIVKLFNLYVYEDKFDNRLIYIKPYVDFYSTDSSNSVDWTYKLNRDKPIKIKPMSEINAKIYNFKYKPDTDYYNDLYKKRYGQTYGDYTFDSEFEFAQQTESFELIFSSTPLVGYLGEEKIYPTIFKKTNDQEERIDSNIRILQTKKVTGVASWNITNDSGATVLTSVTDYGYAGHFDDPDAPTNDLNFGALSELFFSLTTGDLSATQFNVYWSSYMAEITDKDSKLVTGNFYLKSSDIFNLDFSKFIYLDGVLFRLNAIRDYNMTNPSDCLVELIKVNYLIY